MKSLSYMLITLVFGITTLTLIPKPLYKKFLIYGFLLGGMVNVGIILVLSGVFHLFRYLAIGPYGIWGLFSFFTPLSWMFVFMLYLYFMPVRRIFLYPYLIGFIGFAYLFGFLLTGMGLFRFYHHYQYYQPLTFISWFLLAAWVYLKGEKITLL